MFSKILLIFSALLFSQSISSQKEMSYEPSAQFPYGKYNPIAPEQLKDYQDLIGKCKCISEPRNPY